MDATQTLHDFVLNLLVNADARSVFELDPEGALRAAGLADVTVADIQDVLPLVLDTLPLQGVASLDVLNDVGCGGDTVGADPLGVIAQLTAVVRELNVSTQQSTTADVHAAALGVVGADGTAFATTVGSLVAGVDGGSDGVTGDFSPFTDVAHTLDATVLSPETVGSTGLGAAPSVANAPEESAGRVVDQWLGDAVGSAVEGLLGSGVTGVVPGTLGAVGQVADSLGITGAASGVVTSAENAVDQLGVGSVIDGLATTVGDTIGSVGVDGVAGGLAHTVGHAVSEGSVGGLTDALGPRAATGSSGDGSGHGLVDGLL